MNLHDLNSKVAAARADAPEAVVRDRRIAGVPTKKVEFEEQVGTSLIVKEPVGVVGMILPDLVRSKPVDHSFARP